MGDAYEWRQNDQLKSLRSMRAGSSSAQRQVNIRTNTTSYSYLKITTISHSKIPVSSIRRETSGRTHRPTGMQRLLPVTRAGGLTLTAVKQTFGSMPCTAACVSKVGESRRSL